MIILFTQLKVDFEVFNLLIFFLVITSTVSLEREQQRHSDASVLSTNNQIEQPAQSFFDAWKTPGLIKYSLVFACIKGALYGLLFWLPDYLHTVMKFGEV